MAAGAQLTAFMDAWHTLLSSPSLRCSGRSSLQVLSCWRAACFVDTHALHGTRDNAMTVTKDTDGISGTGPSPPLSRYPLSVDSSSRTVSMPGGAPRGYHGPSAVPPWRLDGRNMA